MADISTTEPQEIIAGDTLTWEKSLSNYPASAGYTLKYRLINATNIIDIATVASGDAHLVNVSASTTASYPPGTYTWTSYVEKGSGGSLERYTIMTGTIIVKPSLATQAAGYDTRSHVKRVLDALEAMIEGKATRDAQSIRIGDKEISKMSPQELIKWRSYYVRLYQQELAAEKLNKGLATGRKILTRFK